VPGTPPYALATPVFPFRALALLAGRAPLGGPRETALATLIAARLAAAAAPPASLSGAIRGARAEAARAWMTSVTLPAQARAALLKLVFASEGDDARILATAVGRVADIVSPQLDRAARVELDRLALRFAAQGSHNSFPR
jgi:hypothetical protein